MLQAVKNILVELVLYVLKAYRAVSLKLGLLRVTDGQYGIFDYKGMRCSSLVHDRRRMEKCERYEEFRGDDVIVLTYPKTGTHFVAGVVNSIHLEKGLKTKLPDPMFNACPFEMGFASRIIKRHLKKEKSPRVIASHLPWDLMPPMVKEHKVKVIHCIRNPKDVACSAFPFLKRLGVMIEKTTWEEFLGYFISGKMVYGDYFDFLRQWYPNRNSPNNMYVYYEDMIQDLGRETGRIAEFFGLQLTDEQVERIVEKNTFSNLKKKVGNTVIHRQGKSGTWTSKFTLEQSRAADEWIEKGMQGMDDLKFSYV